MMFHVHMSTMFSLCVLSPATLPETIIKVEQFGPERKTNCPPKKEALLSFHDCLREGTLPKTHMSTWLCQAPSVFTRVLPPFSVVQ